MCQAINDGCASQLGTVGSLEEYKKKGGSEKTWDWDNRIDCTSCKEGRVWVPQGKNGKGRCNPATEEIKQTCTVIDKDVIASPAEENQICVKYGLAAEVTWLVALPPPLRKHFESASNSSAYKGTTVVRCTLAKYTACRNSSCSVKKQVRCHSVCPNKPDWKNNPECGEEGKKGKKKGPGKWYRPRCTPDCGEEGKKFCEGTYTDKAGKKQSYGALACTQIAMMA